MKKLISLTLLLALILLIVPAMAEDKIGQFEPFIRIDRDDPEAYDRELDNLRVISSGTYAFQKINKKYGIPEDYIPDETGLDALDVSASSQFNGWQLKKLADELRAVVGEKEIYVIDLRRESHVLLNDRPFSIYVLHNWSNLGLTADEIMENEERLFSSLAGNTIVAYTKEDDAPGEAYEYEIESYLSEKQLVENEGLHYIRLPVQDHCWPAPEYIDQFIDLVKNVGIDNLWLHFHCSAGKGRTGCFLVMYDKMKNPDIPIKEIAIRQAMLGSSYVLYTDNADSWKAPLYEEKARMTYMFEEYVNENRETNYELPWSEWLNQQGTEEANSQ